MPHSLKAVPLRKALDDADAPSSSATALQSYDHKPQHRARFIHWLKQVFPQPVRKETGLREVIEEFIEDQPEDLSSDPVNLQERLLFSNILNMRDVKVSDIMVPRADIAAVDVNTDQRELLEFMSQSQFSRYPVYNGSLDEVMGSVHLKDIVARISRNEGIVIKDMLTDIPIVSPALPIIDLMLLMRRTSRHMALVVDEYGGIDGLVTIGDVIETIIGEIDDEHDRDEEPQLAEQPDGSVNADARFDIEKFEELYGPVLTQDEREESDTLGGLVFAIAGRIPARGEIITHANGMVFEVLEADPRKINRLKIRNIPKPPEDE